MTATKKTAAKKTAATPPPEPDEPKTDIAAMLPAPGGHLEVAGHDCTVRRIKSRELLLMMRILVTGLGDGFQSFKFDMKNKDEMESQLTAILLMAVPNAIDEFGTFMLSIVEPVDQTKMAEVKAEMFNPDPDVLLDIIGVLVEQEGDDFVSLVGKAQAWIARLQKGLATGSGTG